MKEIMTLNAKVATILEATANLTQRAPQLTHLQLTVFQLQLTFYWWRDATQQAHDLMSSSTGSLVQPSDGFGWEKAPAMFSVGEHLKFITNEIKGLKQEAEDLQNSIPLPLPVCKKLEKGLDCLTTAGYTVDLTQHQYES